MKAAALAAVLLLTVCLRLPFLNLPLERDEGGYAYGAQVLERGGVPYRDTFEHKGPALFFAYRLAFCLFGESTRSVHLMLLFWVLLNQAALFALCLFLFSTELAFWCCLAYALLSFDPSLGLGTAALTEIAMVGPIMLGALALLAAAKRRSAGLFFAAGLALGAAATLKQTAIFEAVFFLAYGLWSWVRGGGDSRGDVLRCGLLYAAGWAVFPAAFCFYFWARGAFQDFFYYYFLYNLLYGVPQSAAVGFSILGRFVLPMFLRSDAVLFLFGLFGLSCLVKKGKAGFPAGWLGAAVLGVLPGFVFFPHYFQQAFPALAMFIGAGLVDARVRVAALCGGRPWASTAAAGLLAAAVFALPLRAHWTDAVSLTPEAASRKNYILQPFADAPAIGEYLRRNTAADDTIFIFGSEPEILFYADRASASRYDFIYPLVERTERARRLQQETAAEVRAAAAKYILIVDIPSSTLEPSAATDLLSRETKRLIEESYTPDGLVVLDMAGSSLYLGRQGLSQAPPGVLGGPGRREAIYLYRRRA